jgi:DNA-binding transcriptional ArsR family regulator
MGAHSLSVLSSALVDDLTQIFRHALRPLILEAIDELGEASPADIAAALGAPLGHVSYHTKVLHRLGWLVLARIERRRGGTRHVYRIGQRPFIDDEAWERLPRSVRRGLARQTLTQILGAAATALKAGGFDAAGAHVDRVPLRLDPAGVRELSALLTKTLAEATEVQQRSDARAGGERAESVMAILHFRKRGTE